MTFMYSSLMYQTYKVDVTFLGLHWVAILGHDNGVPSVTQYHEKFPLHVNLLDSLTKLYIVIFYTNQPIKLCIKSLTLNFSFPPEADEKGVP